MPPILPSEEPFGPGAADLVCHPDFPCPSVRCIQVLASLREAGFLSLDFRLTGDLGELAIPVVLSPGRRERLWEHTCFEAFLREPGTEGYHEWNLAPSTAWAAYGFQSYRRNGAPLEPLDPQIVVGQEPGRLDLHARLQLRSTLAGKPLRLALSAVIEEKTGKLSYWALDHPAGRPDFHHPQAFALGLAPED